MVAEADGKYEERQGLQREPKLGAVMRQKCGLRAGRNRYTPKNWNTGRVRRRGNRN